MAGVMSTLGGPVGTIVGYVVAKVKLKYVNTIQSH